ncbi:MAG: lipid-A-disaccharide synthase [Pegethrix bostrychoides GSE-TBD4-15B]|jgi:lipid-A-disaccharide synthase|uniref:Lipid-A-disaccharide synthase n=1 Tax=Pegethrix bostrychoides GSE-TBD4-15B TaxID=2839662 RepID=A0A951P7S6_9CYAN|nr:lipid-A-disaccharide synthase [Pegethrix bostrychoides GSE-TBD4-15B]
MTLSDRSDILILSNGPGELTTWVSPVLQALRAKALQPAPRISLVLSPCPNASGQEVAIAQRYGIDRIQAAEHFWPFLLWGKTTEDWDWSPQGLVIFLGGDQLFPVIIGRRLGYKTLVYGEWQTRWHRWVDCFAVMRPEQIQQAPARYAAKFCVVGDLMADLTPNLTPDAQSAPAPDQAAAAPLIGLLPGSKSAKLTQGMPLALAIAAQVQQARPQARFVIPVAPTLQLYDLARFADPLQNPLLTQFGAIAAVLKQAAGQPYLETQQGLRIDLCTETPAHALLRQCDLCLTTIGANTAELGALAVPMIVLMPTQQLDAMRAWDGLPGLLANLPGVGSLWARLINAWFLRRNRRQPRFFAWPNIWANRAVVPELLGELQPAEVAALVLDWLDHPEQLSQIRQDLRQVRGEPGAARQMAEAALTLLKV